MSRLIALTACAALLFSTSAFAATKADAQKFTDTLTPVVMQTLNDKNIPDTQKQAKLQALFVQNVDIDWMAKFVLGRAYQSATEDQRTRYVAAYRQYLLAHYTTNFADYGGSKYKITDIIQDDDGFNVKMQVATPSANQDVLLGYHLHTDASGQLKLSDIIVEGVSLITSQRAEYSDVVQQKGMDGLIAALQSKSQAEQKQ